MQNFTVTKELVKSILEHAAAYDWSLQGFGMLRLYLSKHTRLHVWHPDFAVRGVSTIHTHPWDFTSTVVAGQIDNISYVESPSDVWRDNLYYRQRIQCGPGGCAKGEPDVIRLEALPPRAYVKGESYDETAEEIHVSRPEPGTVTIVERRFKADTEHAYVFYPCDKSWVSAEPRAATTEEVIAITQIALKRYF